VPLIARATHVPDLQNALDVQSLSAAHVVGHDPDLQLNVPHDVPAGLLTQPPLPLQICPRAVLLDASQVLAPQDVPAG
jgi:hypothetical protein